LVQIAIEMLPPDIEGVVFACFRGNKAAMGRAHVIEQKALNVIVLERKQMQGLIDTVHELLIALEPAAAGAAGRRLTPTDQRPHAGGGGERVEGYGRAIGAE
jgi:hypothetical protein